MTPDDDPLWYDHAEPDEPLNTFTIILIGMFAVAEFFYVGIMFLYCIFRGGVGVAFRDIKP
jgi:hypothetical protein